MKKRLEIWQSNGEFWLRGAGESRRLSRGEIFEEVARLLITGDLSVMGCGFVDDSDIFEELLNE